MVSLPASSPSCEKSRESSMLSRVLSLLALPAINESVLAGKAVVWIMAGYFTSVPVSCNQSLNVGFSGSLGDWQKSLYLKEKKISEET